MSAILKLQGTFAPTYQAKAPMSATNLSSSDDPAQEINVQNNTVPARNTFFCHLTDGLCLPDRENRPFSMIRTAGKSWSGMDSKIAIESGVSDALGQHTHRGTGQPGQTCHPAGD